MDLKRRLKLYLMGLVLGGIASYFIFGKRLTNTGWTPEARVILRLKTTLIRTTPQAQAALDAMHIDLPMMRAALDSCDVSFIHSRRTDDSLYYEISGPVGGKPVVFTVAALRDYMVDSTATVWSINAK